MKILRLGDPHVKVGNIEESERLIEFVAKIAMERNVDRIEILGDLNHTHAILRLEVLDFWAWGLELLSDICEVVVLVGNHDLTGDVNYNYSALDIFDKLRNKKLHVITTPRIRGPFGYMPYIHDNAKFVEAANYLAQNGAKILVCHQEFNGSKYESGTFAPNGIESDLLQFDTVISGHVHTYQRFGKIIHSGTARWLTDADANEPKGIWIFEHDENGAIISEERIMTDEVCKPIYSFEYKEGEQLKTWPEGARVSVELIGSSAWIEQEKAKLKGKCSVKTRYTDKQKLETRSAGNSFEDFISNLFVSTMDRKNLLEYAKELGIV